MDGGSPIIETDEGIVRGVANRATPMPLFGGEPTDSFLCPDEGFTVEIRPLCAKGCWSAEVELQAEHPVLPPAVRGRFQRLAHAGS